MASTRVDLSTIGIKFGYAVETTAGTKPSAFTQIEKCKSIGGISLEADNIDTTPLESYYRTYIAGLKDTGGTWALTFSNSDAFMEDWNALVTASETARASGLETWAEIYIPGMENACYITFQPGEVPLNEVGVSEALEVEISNIINEYKGWDTAIEPTTATA